MYVCHYLLLRTSQISIHPFCIIFKLAHKKYNIFIFIVAIAIAVVVIIIIFVIIIITIISLSLSLLSL